MVYSFARIDAALAMRVENVFVQNRRLWVRLREKDGVGVGLRQGRPSQPTDAAADRPE